MSNSSQKRLVLLTNIPTPYRNYHYALLARVCAKHNIHFEVWFMAESEAGRFWEIAPSQWAYDGTILSGLHLNFREMTFHINPSAWLQLIRNPPTWLILSGWQLPTNIISHIIARKDTHTLIWAEANQHAARHQHGFIAQFRRWMLLRSDAIVIPGQTAKDTIQKSWGITNQKLLYLPNLIDESLVGDTVDALRLRRDYLRNQHQLDSSQKILYWSARLIDSKKGILNFLNAIHTFPVTILLAGEGQDRPLIEAWMNEHPHFDLHLLGHLSSEQVLEYLAISDVAILPSLSDPNPLALIEAIWAGLPALASHTCGNWQETVLDTINGWLVDPFDPISMQNAVAQIVASSDTQLIAMGAESRKLAQQNFTSTKKAEEFIRDLLTSFHIKED